MDLGSPEYATGKVHEVEPPWQYVVWVGKRDARGKFAYTYRLASNYSSWCMAMQAFERATLGAEVTVCITRGTPLAVPMQAVWENAKVRY